MNIRQMLFMLVNFRNTNISDLAKKLGMSRQNLHTRMKRGTLTKDELSKIAKVLGCRYVSCFVLPGGIIIGDKINTRRLVKPAKRQYDKKTEAIWD